MKYDIGSKNIWNRYLKRVRTFCNPLAHQTVFRKKQYGVSLVELLVSLTMAAILISVAVPSMKFFIVETRITTTADEVYGSVMLARSEAIKRQKTVSLCSTLDHVTCDETNSGWHYGWLIFTDESEDGLLNGRDQLISRVSDLTHLISITWNRGFNLRFNSRGQTSQAGTFKVCDQESSEQDSKAIVISMTGRLRTEDQSACS
ncbi:MAG: GspH/FimT family pseudopilin [Endozoicomonas sp.]